MITHARKYLLGAIFPNSLLSRAFEWAVPISGSSLHSPRFSVMRCLCGLALQSIPTSHALIMSGEPHRSLSAS
jgi:hypothetical protein